MSSSQGVSVCTSNNRYAASIAPPPSNSVDGGGGPHWVLSRSPANPSGADDRLGSIHNSVRIMKDATTSGMVGVGQRIHRPGLVSRLARHACHDGTQLSTGHNPPPFCDMRLAI